MFKWLFRALFALVLSTSLAVNVASFTGAALWTAASAGWSTITGAVSFAQSSSELLATSKSNNNRLQRSLTSTQKKTARLKLDIGVERAARQSAERKLRVLDDKIALRKAEFEKQTDGLRSRNQKLKAELQSEIATRRAIQKEAALLRPKLNQANKKISALGSSLDDSPSRKVLFKGSRMPVREAVAETTDGISRRIARSAARDVASMPGEAIPFWGTAVIVGVTAAELLDLCNTLRDLHALKVAFSPDAEFGADETAVCAIKVPTREELWRSTKAAPGDAWSAAREFVPTLEEIQAWELTDLDYGGIWGAAKSGTASYTGWITSETGRVSSETLDATVQFGTDVTNQAGSKASDGIQSLRNWLNSD